MRYRTSVAALLAALPLAVAPGACGAEVINSILATVDGEPVTLYQVKQFRDTDARVRQAGEVSQKDLLDAVINEKIVEREVADKGIVVRDEEIEAYIKSIKERNNLDDARLNEALRAQGFTPEGYRKQVRADMQKQQLIAREIRGKVSVSQEEIERYYKAHQDEYSTRGGLELSHILIRLAPNAGPAEVAAAMAKAQQVRDGIQGREDFLAAAKRYSEDPNGAEGGKLGFFKKGELLEPMEQAAARLKPGEISQPVRTKLGVHILMVESRAGDGKTDLGEVQDKIKQELYQQAIEERFRKWTTEDLRQHHQVEVLR